MKEFFFIQNTTFSKHAIILFLENYFEDIHYLACLKDNKLKLQNGVMNVFW